MAEFSEEMADYIRGWGTPKILDDVKDDIIFKFDDNNLFDMKEEEKDYHCRKNSVKFCLFNIKQKEILFTMDFCYSERNPFDTMGPRVSLRFIYTHSNELRKKGIADYYISKLREYAISKNAECINVSAVQNVVISEQDNRRDILQINDLENFYRKRDTPEMPVIVSVLNN